MNTSSRVIRTWGPGLAWFGLWAASGCTWENGDSFATLRPALEARLSASPARDAGDGWQKLSSDYQVRFTSASMELLPFELRDSGAAGAGFDPANPPPGYGLCHNGHCHRDDGALISYQEVAASLPGGRPPAVVVRLPVSGALDLLAGVPRDLDCEPSCELALGTLSQVQVGVTRLTLEGRVRDSRATPRLNGEIPFRHQVEFSPQVSQLGELDIPVDRREPPLIDLQLLLEPGAPLFDPLDWAALDASGGLYDFGTAPNQAAAQLLRERLGELPIQTTVRRGIR